MHEKFCAIFCSLINRLLFISPVFHTDVTIIETEIKIVILTENQIQLKSKFSCIPSNDLSSVSLDSL